MRNIAFSLVVFLFLLNTSPAFAETGEPFLVVGDLLIARPAGLAATIIGGAVFLVSLPFALTSNSVKQTGETLVSEPFAFTFTRPLGDFRYGYAYVRSGKTRNVREGKDNPAEKENP